MPARCKGTHKGCPYRRFAMLIAVATKTGREIDQHFGHAERFLIYSVNNGTASLVDEKKVERYCTYDPEHPMRTHVLAGIAAALTGCRAIVCSQIGQSPQDEMERLGFSTFALTGEIGPALVELARVL